jgi:hypothetical protein
MPVSRRGVKTRKIIKSLVIAALSALNVYLLYGAVACLVLWKNQPDFIMPDGGITTSVGFLIESCIFLGLFIIAAAALILVTVNKRR